jgi:folate-binding Fe-S cluster repair protein YgfZ
LVEGDSAEGYLQRIVTCDVASLESGRSRYGLLCNEEGGILDDVLIYRLGSARYLVISNAGAYDIVEPWLERWAAYEAALSLQDLTLKTAMLAIQGPEARSLLTALLPETAELPHGACIETSWEQGPLLLREQATPARMAEKPFCQPLPLPNFGKLCRRMEPPLWPRCSRYVAPRGGTFSLVRIWTRPRHLGRRL